MESDFHVPRGLPIQDRLGRARYISAALGRSAQRCVEQAFRFRQYREARTTERASGACRTYSSRADRIDPADLPPPLDELRAQRMRRLEAAGKIRLIARVATFPIEDYLGFLFRTDKLTAIVRPQGGDAARAITTADWAFLEVAGGDGQRLFVRQIGERDSTFGDVRVAREQVLAVFPPVDEVPAQIGPQTAKGGPAERRTKQAERLETTIEGLKRFFPDGPNGKSRIEITQELKTKLGVKSLSVGTLDRAKKKVWRSRSSNRTK